jgi:FHA domain
MLNKFFTKPVELKIGDQNYKFCSVADFEFSLSGRTAVPSRKITDMVQFSTDQLRKEAKTIKDIEKRFVAILSKSIEDPSSINRAIREMDPVIFSQDHNWREVISSLNTGHDELNPFRRIALVKYMQYLSARQEIIKYLYSEKRRILNEPIELPQESSQFKETVLLDNTIFEPSSENLLGAENYERIPKGESVVIKVEPGTHIDVLLSRYPCKIVNSDDKMQFIDNNGRTSDLKNGRNVIGRDTVSTIMMDPVLRDISRIHLIIEKRDNKTIQITDMSSHGSYILKRYLDSHTGF